MALTPMMQQYLQIKEKYQDCILFFRLGDFYEMFFEDAIEASKAMEVALTGKSCGMEERAPMCGVPYHAADTYIAKLIEKGYKVAICEQMEDPAQAKGIVRREVIRIITPGTVISQNMLSERENNFLACIWTQEKESGIAFCDLSTGEIHAGGVGAPRQRQKLIDELAKLQPAELLACETLEEEGFREELKPAWDGLITFLKEDDFQQRDCQETICRQFGVQSLKGLGIEEMPGAVKALGALLSYLKRTQKHSLSHFTHLEVYDTAGHMSLDKATLKNLELTETLYDKKTTGSLLGVLDRTLTAMGGRKMKQWLKEPLNSLEPICRRLDAVEALTEQILLRNDLRQALGQIYDLERLSGRIACGSANGRDLLALKQSVSVLPEIRGVLSDFECGLLKDLYDQMDDLSHIHQLIDQAIVDEPPYTIREGGLIAAGFSLQLDQLKDSIREGQQWIASLEASERERTGIKNLKVGFNKVFGYYIEVTKSNYDLIPENYIRKQTLANCERFITPELKEVESAVLGAEAKINQMEYEIFLQIRFQIEKDIALVQKTSLAVAELDVLVSFAETAAKLGYVKPQVNTSDEILIERGRHPVIEQTIRDGVFVSNDTYLDRHDSSLLLITGPNMAGKSTYMRQTALIVLMAQAGSFVPCEKACIGMVDRIYTRIGASDNLAQGQSTFYVEMSELAYILNTATEKSLVILDEIGRGTSTYDGLSIAWASIEYLCKTKKQVRTLFATHYHELTSLEGNIKGVRNLNVDVQEENGAVVFLHKITQGSASRSYGIHVARIAGVPKLLLETAEEKLSQLEKTSVDLQSVAGNTGPGDEAALTDNAEKDAAVSENAQLSFFGFAPNPLVERLKGLDLMNITPSQAFQILEELQKAAKG